MTLREETIREQIINGRRDFSNSVIENLDLSGMIIDGNLIFDNVDVKGAIKILDAKIKGSIIMTNMTIYGLYIIFNKSEIHGDIDLSNTGMVSGSIWFLNTGIEGGLNFKDSCIEKGELLMLGLTIGGDLCINMASGPKLIRTSPELAELVHHAAPTTPIMTVKSPKGVTSEIEDIIAG